jgi:hypothetical protein
MPLCMVIIQERVIIAWVFTKKNISIIKTIDMKAESKTDGLD